MPERGRFSLFLSFVYRVARSIFGVGRCFFFFEKSVSYSITGINELDCPPDFNFLEKGSGDETLLAK